jgi:hypothetical protein
MTLKKSQYLMRVKRKPLDSHPSFAGSIVAMSVAQSKRILLRGRTVKVAEIVSALWDKIGRGRRLADRESSHRIMLLLRRGARNSA